MNRRVTSPKRVISPTWGPPPPCKQALIQDLGMREGFQSQKYKTKEARLVLQSGIYIFQNYFGWHGLLLGLTSNEEVKLRRYNLKIKE